MKFYIQSASLLSEATKALRNALARHEIKISLSKAQESLARVLGFENLYALRHSKPIELQPLDHELEPDRLRERRRLQAERLKDYLRLTDEIALAVIEEAKPSGIRRKLKAESRADFPQDLLAEIKTILHQNVASSLRQPIEALVESHILRLLSARPINWAQLNTMSVDEYLSQRLPQLKSTIRFLDPEALEKGLGTDGIEEWKRTGPDKPGWNMVKDQLDPLFDNAASWLDPKKYFDPYRDIKTRIAEACSCDISEVPSCVRDRGILRQIVDDAVAHLRAEIGTRPVVDLVIKPRNQHGFYEWRPGIEDDEADRSEFWRPLHQPERPSDIKRDVRKVEFHVGSAQVTLETTRERPHMDYEEDGSAVAFYFFLAKATVEQKVVGLVRGELLIDRTFGSGMHDSVLYEAAESLSEDLTLLAHIILTQHMHATKLFAMGDLIYLSHWEVVPELRGTGFASDLLKAVVAEHKRRFKRLNSIVYELHPAQFPHSFDRSLPSAVVHRYDEARSRISQHLLSIGFPKYLSLSGHSIQFEVTPDQEALTDNQRFDTHWSPPEDIFH